MCYVECICDVLLKKGEVFFVVSYDLVWFFWVGSGDSWVIVFGI